MMTLKTISGKSRFADRFEKSGFFVALSPTRFAPIVGDVAF
jgi:hypothetical protein